MPPRWPKPKPATKVRKTRVKVPSEELECMRLIDYLKSKKLIFSHIANSTFSKVQGIKNKRMGVSPGVPDYIVLVPGHVVWIEMKRLKGSSVSFEQLEWIAALKAVGQHAYICKGFEAAKVVIDSYLSPKSQGATE